MNATKILWTQVLVVCSVALAFVWGATQWTAAALGYQAQLGRPWFRLDGWPVYHPPAFFWWWFAYDAYAPQVFVHGAYIAASGGLAAVVAAIAMSVWRAREAKQAQTYGSARWACLNASWFMSLADARERIEAWRIDYNTERPHSALGHLTPKAFARQAAEARKVS